MSKKMKALQISALLTAVSGATLLMPAASSPANAAEVRTIDERCWDKPSEYRRLHNCDFIQYQYGLTPGTSPDGIGENNNTVGPDAPEGGSGGPGGGGTDPDPVDPYTS